MIWLILAVVVSVFLIISIWRYDVFETIIGRILGSVGCLVICLLVSLLPLVISSAIITASDVELEETKTTAPIYALSDNAGVAGHFFLGSGSLDGKLSYYYVENTEYGKHVVSVLADHAFIAESDKPTITVIEYDWENGWWNWLGGCMKNDRYIFAVPSGTITDQYSIDLQ